MAQEGTRLQVDGSRHDWVEGRGPYMTRVGGIDDATGQVPAATFREQEDAQAYVLMLRQVVVRKGVPLAMYSDRHGIFVKTRKQEPGREERLAGRRQPTPMGRLLDELEAELILARSPQATGRIERLWGTLQDRLCSEWRLQGVATLDAANVLLAKHLVRHHRRFALPAQDPSPAWRPRPRDPDALFCFTFHRVVALDHTVRFGSQVIDIPRLGPRTQARARLLGPAALRRHPRRLPRGPLPGHLRPGQPAARAPCAWELSPSRNRHSQAASCPPSPPIHPTSRRGLWKPPLIHPGRSPLPRPP